MEDAVKPTTPLILSAFAFGALWSGWMLWLSGDAGTLAITAICAVVAGCLWYRIMRWCFRLMRLLPHTGPNAAR